MSQSVTTNQRAGVPPLRPMAKRRSVLEHIRELTSYRELLTNLTRKELTVRYQHSALGFVWSMLQPAFLLVVYTVAFRILGAGFARFSIWVLCGLLVWTFLSTALLSATKSITTNHSLVGKVRFPRAVLPLASVTSALVHLALQSVAFAILLAVVRHPVDWAYMWLLPFAVLTVILIVTALALLLAPLNVYARDTGHLLELLILGWFWATPILYQYRLGWNFLRDNGLPDWLQLANPLTPVVISVQRAIYGTDVIPGLEPDPRLLPEGGPLWYLSMLGITAAVALVVCALALKAFDRAEVNLVEAL